MSNKFYQQADDLYTGCSSSPCFTKIYIQGCEEIMIHIMIQASVIWLPKVHSRFVMTRLVKNYMLYELNEKMETLCLQ